MICKRFGNLGTGSKIEEFLSEKDVDVHFERIQLPVALNLLETSQQEGNDEDSIPRALEGRKSKELK